MAHCMWVVTSSRSAVSRQEVGPHHGIKELPEGNTHTLADDYYIKSMCPSGGPGRGHRLALQNRAAARHIPYILPGVSPGVDH